MSLSLISGSRGLGARTRPNSYRYLYIFPFRHISLCSRDWLETPYVDQAGLEFTGIHLAGVEGVYTSTPDPRALSPKPHFVIVVLLKCQPGQLLVLDRSCWMLDIQLRGTQDRTSPMTEPPVESHGSFWWAQGFPYSSTYNAEKQESSECHIRLYSNNSKPSGILIFLFIHKHVNYKKVQPQSSR